jgi:tetratricopeptide (TPR) repeat protein
MTSDPYIAYIKKTQARLTAISNQRHKVIDQTKNLYQELLEMSQSTDIPDFIWSSISLDFYHINQLELAEEAMLRAVKVAQKLEGNDRKYLSSIYGNLGMIYTAKEEYSKAVAAKRNVMRLG